MPSEIVYTWNDQQWMNSVMPALNKGLAAAATVFADRADRNFGSEGGGVKGSASLIDPSTGEYKGRLKLKGKPQWIPAPPGKYPGRRTGHLAKSVAVATPDALGTPLHAAYGTATQYGRWLELGTSKMPARPWIVRSATEAKQQASEMFVMVAKAELIKAGLSK